LNGNEVRSRKQSTRAHLGVQELLVSLVFRWALQNKDTHAMYVRSTTHISRCVTVEQQ